MAESKNSTSKLAQYVRAHAGHDTFPDKASAHFDRFVLLDNYLNETVHPNVNQGATAREPIWLTDHGPEHIATVIARASDLVFPDECVLTPYEAYLLLVAIHFHDVGNIFGRDEHERRSREVMFGLNETLVGNDMYEKRMICDIAMAHGGYVDDKKTDKDTIGKLRYDRPRRSDKNGVRARMLAAILRFADELADDRTRTSRFIMNAQNQLHPGSEIYHMYADRLRRVNVNAMERIVEIRFELNESVVSRKYAKRDSQRYLIEEIVERTLKMHREHLYCNRFMQPEVNIDRILIRIDVCANDYSAQLGIIEYEMAPQGYPESPKDLKSICPELTSLTGSELKRRVRRLVQNSNGNAGYTLPQNLLDQ